MKKAAMAASEVPTFANQANAEVDNGIAGGKSTKFDWLNLGRFYRHRAGGRGNRGVREVGGALQQRVLSVSDAFSKMR
jgi:hypothetical protein